MKRKPPKKPAKLRGKTREMASKFIAEEMRTHQYPKKQAIAIGISRAKASAGKSRTMSRLRNMLKKYQ